MHAHHRTLFRCENCGKDVPAEKNPTMRDKKEEGIRKSVVSVESTKEASLSEQQMPGNNLHTNENRNNETIQERIRTVTPDGTPRQSGGLDIFLL